MLVKTKKQSGFTLVEIMIVVAIIGLLAAIALPNFLHARETAQLNSIYNNLRIISAAKDQWALENKKGTGDTTDLTTISAYLKGGTVKPFVSESYSIEPIGTAPYATSPVQLGTYTATVHIQVE